MQNLRLVIKCRLTNTITITNDLRILYYNVFAPKCFTTSTQISKYKNNRSDQIQLLLLLNKQQLNQNKALKKPLVARKSKQHP